MIDCDWNQPGNDPYTGTVAQAVSRYDIPKPIQMALIAKASVKDYEALVTIKRESIDKGFADLRGMHFGNGVLCKGDVNRSKWKPDHVERALVYCSGAYCIAVPLVCRNVSLISRRDPLPTTSREKHAKIELFPGEEELPRMTVPEPESLSLVGLALLAMAWVSKRRKK